MPCCPQQLQELNQYAEDRVREVLGRYKTRYVVDGRELSPGQMIERLGFKKEHLNARVKDLSGGQKRRLQFMLILLDEPNVLILDEPGNDLDTDMLAVMEDLLDAWPGTLLLVTHDRYLMERVTDDQFALVDGKVVHLPGGVTNTCAWPMPVRARTTSRSPRWWGRMRQKRPFREAERRPDWRATVPPASPTTSCAT